MPDLFSPLKIREIEFKNRIVVSPMCEYSSEDGFANDWHLVHLGSRAIGGAALVIAEATAVSPEGRITPHDLGIWKDEHIPFLKRITDFIHAHDSIAGIQLAHAGRKASHTQPWKGGDLLLPEAGGWKTVAPSPIAFSEEYDTPVAMDKADIEKVINDFAEATKRAVKAGFKVVEIHGAHGYLINEFLSPLSNHRTDEYGGSFDNRMRFLLEVTEAVQAHWPKEYPLFLRISASDWIEGGWTIEDSIRLAQIMKSQGIDLIDCWSGGLASNAVIQPKPGYQVGFADEVKNKGGILSGAVG
ncbi:MAG: NADH:flavin oxidoreductase/NADH oxidase, partial [Chitinophagaceae bacterium]|nr:NADH:flavin oxidoreductase/NADH oxidase [Chitinophagaceae bacterium]